MASCSCLWSFVAALLILASAGENRTSLSSGDNETSLPQRNGLLSTGLDHPASRIVVKHKDKDFHVFPDTECKDVGLYKRFPFLSHNFSECLDLCGATPWCNVVQMSCGTRCTLYNECSEVVFSGCHSYLTAGRNRDYPVGEYALSMQRKRFNPWSSVFLGTLFFLGVTFAFADHVWKKEDSYDEAMYTEMGKRSPRSRKLSDAHDTEKFYAGVDGGEIHGGVSNLHGTCYRYTFVVGAFLVIILVLGSSFIPLPEDDGRYRGVCGLARNHSQPVTVSSMFASFFVPFQHRKAEADITFQESGQSHTGIEEMPMTCWSILNTDYVNDDSGPDCRSWCHKHIGMVPRPICGLVPTFGSLFKVCMKVRTWSLYHWLFNFMPFATFYKCWLVAIAYGCVSISIGYYRASDNRTTQTVAPSQSRCESHGPFTGRTYLYCFRRAPCDYSAARRQLLFTICSILPDPFLDINGLLVFLSVGQPYYAAAYFIGIFAPNMRDPLQSTTSELYFTSYYRGWRVQGTYIIEKRAGAIEGNVTLIAAMHALFGQSLFGGVTWGMYLSVGLSAMSSLFITLPNSAVARDVLESDADFDDYYVIEQTITVLGSRKYLPALDAFALAAAMARTFSSSHLMSRLYGFGVAWGFVQWLIYRFFVKKQVPSAQQVLRFFLAFAFWPLAATRLMADADIYNQMSQGTSRLSDCALYGCASLHPVLFYTVRIATLVSFWIGSHIHSPHFVPHRLTAVKQAYADGTLLELQNFRQLFCVVLLFLGWLAIIGEALLFWIYRNKFKLLHKIERSDEQVTVKQLHHAPSQFVGIASLRRQGTGHRLF